MADVTAGRSAGTVRNAELDPMGRSDAVNRRLTIAGRKHHRIIEQRDPTAGRSAGTAWNAEFDPMGRSDEENRRRTIARLSSSD